MNPARSNPRPHDQIPRLVWTLSAVGICLGAVVVVLGVQALERVDQQHALVRRTTAQAELNIATLAGARQLASGVIASHLEAAPSLPAGPPPADRDFERLFQDALEQLTLATGNDGAVLEATDSIRAEWSGVSALLAEAVQSRMDRARTRALIDESWVAFDQHLSTLKADIDKAQGRARLELQAGLRRAGPAYTATPGTAHDRLLELAHTADAARTLTVELGDLTTTSRQLRWTTDPELLRSLRDNSLRQTLERLRWISRRLPDQLQATALPAAERLSREVLGPDTPNPQAPHAGADLCSLKSRELEQDASARRLRDRADALHARLHHAEEAVAAAAQEVVHRQADRAAAIYKRVWRDTLLLGSALLASFLLLSQRIARLGRKTESVLRTKNTQLERATAGLERLATTDTLTGLPNRRVFVERLNDAIRRSREGDNRHAVLFFDFDRFKIVNDSLGHQVGDALLRDIADIFRAELREADTVARFGGDEFVVLLDRLHDDADANACAERLLHRFAEPHTVGNHTVVSTASVGLVHGAPRYENAYLMLRDADAAMYRAKESGRGRIAVYDQQLHAAAITRLTIEQDLHRAVESGQLRLMYQPIVELESGDLAGFEALLRWEHPGLGSVPPLSFIPIAEDAGTIVKIGRWALNGACEQAARWNAGLPNGRRVSVNVNVSKRQLIEPDFCDEAIACIHAHDLRPGDIKFEITESLIAYDPAVIIPRLERLRAAGIPIVMDDFGTGVSSLSVLHECPIDNLKIDQAFVRALDGNRSLVAVVASVTALADNLGVGTVAEGIEDEQAVCVLLSVGCRWGQGYYFGAPLTPARATSLVAASMRTKGAA